jgi:hypothetical protein
MMQYNPYLSKKRESAGFLQNHIHGRNRSVRISGDRLWTDLPVSTSDRVMQLYSRHYVDTGFGAHSTSCSILHGLSPCGQSGRIVRIDRPFPSSAEENSAWIFLPHASTRTPVCFHGLNIWLRIVFFFLPLIILTIISNSMATTMMMIMTAQV